jgi:hypothetical protein
MVMNWALKKAGARELSWASMKDLKRVSLMA